MIAALFRQFTQALTAITNAEGGADLPWTFYHSELYEMNENDSPEYPFVHLVHPLIGKDLINEYGVTGTEYTLKLFFLTKSLLEYKMSEREGEVQKMITAKNQFIQKILQAIATPVVPPADEQPHITKLVGVDHEEMFNEFDSNLDGVLVTMTLQVAQKVC